MGDENLNRKENGYKIKQDCWLETFIKVLCLREDILFNFRLDTFF